jgi:hypothetical protein
MKKYVFLYILFTPFLIACNPIKLVFTDPISPQNFKSYETFAFGELTKRPAVNRANSESVKEFVEQAVTREMEQRGIELVEENPDLIVDLYTSLRSFDRQQTSRTFYNRRGFFNYYRYGFPPTNQARLETEDNMSIIVNLTLGDANNKIKVASGEVEANLTRNASKSAQRLDEAVDKLVGSIIQPGQR